MTMIRRLCGGWPALVAWGIAATSEALSQAGGPGAPADTLERRGDSIASVRRSHTHTLLGGGLIHFRNDRNAYFGSIAHHSSSAPMNAYGTFTFATIGCRVPNGFFGYGPILDAGLGVEFLANRLSIDITGGINLVILYPLVAPYFKGSIGYEIPITDDVGVRVEGGPLYFLSSQTPLSLHAGIGFAIR